MTMEKDNRNIQIERYLDNAEAEFDRIVETGEKKHRRIVRWTALTSIAVAACIGLVFWLVPARPVSNSPLTPVQITEGIQQMMLMNIGEIESIVATPMDNYAILTAHLTDGTTCSFILRCNDAEGTTTLLAYTNNK